VKNYDVIIIGGGIVGLATAYRLTQRYPKKKLAIVEKEPTIARHQTGHNSGVLHTGIYYKPGSLKAINCREGKLAMQRFCDEHGIAYELCGKVIVAVDESEVGRLENIYERGQENGVNCKLIDADRLHEIEPHVAGVKAIEVPEAGIIDYTEVCQKLAQLVHESGCDIHLSTRVTGMQHQNGSTVVETTQDAFEAPLVVNCSGLHNDRVTKMSGATPASKIVPFRGEYYKLKPDKHYLCRTLIYPVPDPSFPFLGVHFTKMIHGDVECGPNAVLAFAREGYTRNTVNVRDLAESLTYPGFLRLASRHWRAGFGELWRSFSKAAFVKALQRLMPEITAEDLEPAPAGVRAQALKSDGTMVDDFLIQPHGNVVNVGNAPSPAATSSLNIGNLIVDQLESRLV